MKDLSIKKLYYSISEVSKITNVEQYVLRYWETEFVQLKPQKNRAGNRIFTNKDINLILHIKALLRERKYTIVGAKKMMEDFSYEKMMELNNLQEKNVCAEEPQVVNDIKLDVYRDLKEIKNTLELILSKL
jgi:DNA-binding transcriptional MerR regulator